MIIIDMTQFRRDRTEDEAQAAVRRLLFPFLQPAADEGPHTHEYAIVLVSKDQGDGYELSAFEAPCPVDDAPANIRAVVQALRDVADEVEAGHADILAEADEGQADEAEDVPAHVLVDLLGLVGVYPTEAEVEAWDSTQRQQAAAWASAVHLVASDNDVPVPARPEFLAEEG